MRLRRLVRTSVLATAALMAPLALASGTALATTSGPAPNPAVVTTAGGIVRGTVTADHRVFSGIPYAAPPVGRLRWQPPQPAAPWSGTRDATKPASPCAQVPLAVLPGASNRTGSTSENCLYLNVWTPRQPSTSPRPVYVWLHGGSNIFGAGSDYDGTKLVTRGDIIVVTVNYRLGPLGFLAHPALSAQSHEHASGDYGLQDQQAALRWVQRNAAAFGGDPHEVTAGGESAGSFDTCAQIASPTAPGLFARAIQESGSCTAGGSAVTPTLATASASGETFAASVGCRSSANLAAVAACLRAVPAAKLIVGESTATWGFNTGPAVLPISPAAAWALGRVNRVPVLNGSNHDEYRFFTAVLVDLVGGKPLTPATYAARVRAEYPGTADAVLAEYPASRYPSPNLAYAALKTDNNFSCRARADDLLYSGSVPTFAYEFNDPNSPPFVQDKNTPQGAFHASEIAFLFPPGGRIPLPAASQRLSDTMVGYWTRFIRSGDPNGSGLPAWPSYTRSGDAIQSLTPQAQAPLARGAFAAFHHCGFWQTTAGIPSS